ncbi:MAG TPA: alpha-mannosidase [Firmicutes bacterium]|nr:alpha-mannosidase [Bacillota bacterium]
MFSPHDITKIEKRCGWLRHWFYEPVQDLTVTMATTREHIRHLAVDHLQFGPISPGTSWGQEWDSAWFKTEYEITTPPHEKLFLQVNTGGESIVYIDGKAAGAIDRQHFEIPLTQRELVVGKHRILIESYGGHHIPSRDPAPRQLPKGQWQAPVYKHCRLVRRNEVAWHLYFDLRTLLEIALELPEDSLRRARILDTLSTVVDNIAWDTHDQSLQQTHCAAARKALAPLLALKNAPTTPTLHLVGHAHIDIAYLWPLSETIRKCGRTFATQLRIMEEYPEYIFLQSQAQAYAYVEKYYPEIFSRIKKAVQKSHWEVNGGMWVEPDTNIPSTESLIRQFLVGEQYFQQKLGVRSDTLWLPDVFGYSGNLPQIIKGCGIDYFVTSKIGWNATNRFPYDLFRWEGIDGTVVLAHYIKLTYNGQINPRALWTHWREFQPKELTDTVVHAVGFGDGGGGMTMENMEFARRLQDLEGAPKARFGTISDLMTRLADNQEAYPLWRGELYLELHRGTLTSQAWTKRNNRKLEFLLRETEILASAAYLLTGQYPSHELTELWKQVLTNQFHDILPGSSIEQVYTDCHRIYGEVANKALALRDQAMESLLDGMGKKSAEKPQLVLLNTLNWDRRDPLTLPVGTLDEDRYRIGDCTVKPALLPADGPVHITDEKGNPIPSQWSKERLVFIPEVKGMALRTYYLEPGHCPLPPEDPVVVTLQGQVACLENQLIRVEVDTNGQLLSVYDKEAQREVLPPGQRGNVVLMAEDLPLNYDAWEIEKYYRQAIEEVRGGTMTVIEEGPVQGRIRITRTFGEGSTWTQDIVLNTGSKRLDFETKVDWQEVHRLLKVAFPVDVNSREVNYEIQNGYITRPSHENTSWDQARFEVCGHKWCDISEPGYGAALLNDCKYGHDAVGNVLRLTLLKAATGPDATADRGIHVFTYAFLPHQGSLQAGEVSRYAHELNIPYGVELRKNDQPQMTDYQLLKLEGGQLFLHALKKAENSLALVVRFGELVGQRGKVALTFPKEAKTIAVTNHLEENPVLIATKTQRVELEIGPFEIKTLLVEI